MANAKETVPVSADGGLGQVNQILQMLGGTKTTQKTTADTSGLTEVLKQALASGGDNQALLDSIFAQAQTKIPGIMGNTYNATGSRQAPGKLSPQMAQLQAQVTLAAQQQMAAQKQQALQTAAQAAGGIANATRQSVTSEGNGLQKQTQALAGLLSLNKLAKDNGIDVVKGAKGLWDDMTTPDTSSILNAPGGVWSDAGVSSIADYSADGITGNSATGWDALGQDAVSSLMSSLGSGGVVADTNSVDWSNFLADSGSAAASGSVDISAAVQPAQVDGIIGAQANTGQVSSASPDTSGISVAGAIKILDYAGDPKKRGNILDLSDGNWIDDVSDITDAGSILVPQLGYVRNGLNAADSYVGLASGKDIQDTPIGAQLLGLTSELSSNPPEDLEDIGRTVGGGPGAGFGDLVQDTAHFFENPGQGIKDLFGW
jgi:hypothetical protein